MGDMTEHLEHLHSDSIGSERVWVTREGQEIPTGDLSDTHLANIIRMLRRVEATTGKFRNELTLDAHRFLTSCNGDAARDAVEQSIISLDNSSVDDVLKEAYPKFKYLLEEQESRQKAAPKF